MKIPRDICIVTDVKEHTPTLPYQPETFNP